MESLEVAVELEMELGEGAFWDDARHCLVWVDILGGSVHELGDNGHRVFDTGTHVGVAAPRASGGWVLAVRDGFAAFDPVTEKLEMLARVEAPGTRMNDGNVDSRGRFFAGSMRYTDESDGGRVYRLDPELSVSVVLDPVSVSNGVDWSIDERYVYYVDSPTHNIVRFDFDADSGLWFNGTIWATIEHGLGVPDGLTVDADGGVWVAVWNGSQVRRYLPDGRLERVIDVPAPRVTSCGFGGPDLSTLYITTARAWLTPDQLERYPLSGSVFAIDAGVTGRPRHAFTG